MTQTMTHFTKRSDIEDLTKLTTAAVGMATTGVCHDDAEAGSEIGKGTNDNISVYLLPLCKKDVCSFCFLIAFSASLLTEVILKCQS